MLISQKYIFPRDYHVDQLCVIFSLYYILYVRLIDLVISLIQSSSQFLNQGDTFVVKLMLDYSKQTF